MIEYNDAIRDFIKKISELAESAHHDDPKKAAGMFYAAGIAHKLMRPEAIDPGLSGVAESLFPAALAQATKASQKFPQPNYTALKIAEEAGEVIKALVHYAENRGSWQDVKDESVDAVAMILRVLREGDQVNGIIPPKNRTGYAEQN